MQIATVSGLVVDLASRSITLEDVISMNLHDSHALEAATSRRPMAAIVKRLGSYLDPLAFSAGDVVYDFGDDAETVLMLLSGSLVTVLDFLSYTECGFSLCKLLLCSLTSSPCASRVAVSYSELLYACTTCGKQHRVRVRVLHRGEFYKARIARAPHAGRHL